MREIQLVLTDFDGTVAEFGKHVVSEKVREAVIACEEAGVRMIPVTGRYHTMAQPVLEVLGFEDLGVFDNGASIQNSRTGELVWSQWLEPNVVKQITRVLAPVSRIIDYTPEHDEHEPADNELERLELIDMPTSHVYALVDKEHIDSAIAQLAQIAGIGFYSAQSTRTELADFVGIQVNHIAADKFHGVNALRDIIGVPKEHTLAIGDGDNDIPLFQNAGLKIAMGNATELLKTEADHIVATIEDDGFAEAMHRFVLN